MNNKINLPDESIVNLIKTNEHLSKPKEKDNTDLQLIIGIIGTLIGSLISGIFSKIINPYFIIVFVLLIIVLIVLIYYFFTRKKYVETSFEGLNFPDFNVVPIVESIQAPSETYLTTKKSSETIDTTEEFENLMQNLSQEQIQNIENNEKSINQYIIELANVEKKIAKNYEEYDVVAYFDGLIMAIEKKINDSDFYARMFITRYYNEYLTQKLSEIKRIEGVLAVVMKENNQRKIFELEDEKKQINNHLTKVTNHCVDFNNNLKRIYGI